jgi:uncharacterized protein YjlB
LEPQVETHQFAPGGEIPNSPLPLVVYRGGLPAALCEPAGCQALFYQNDWTGNWVNGIFDYWHFHVTGPEVLGCVAGEAEVGFGGDHGIKTTVKAGDVVVIPAGVGHNRLSAKRGGFTIVGGYPPGQSGMISRPGDFSVPEAERLIAALGPPRADPLTGGDGALFEAWGLR